MSGEWISYVSASSLTYDVPSWYELRMWAKYTGAIIKVKNIKYNCLNITSVEGTFSRVCLKFAEEDMATVPRLARLRPAHFATDNNDIASAT